MRYQSSPFRPRNKGLHLLGINGHGPGCGLHCTPHPDPCRCASFRLGNTPRPPPPSPPPLVLPPLSFPGGWGRGTVTWSTPKFCYGSLCCVEGQCVVRHCHLHTLAADFESLSLKWNLIAQPWDECDMCSTGAPALVQAVGYSEHGDACAASLLRVKATLLHDCASVHCLSLPRVCSPPHPAHAEASSSTRAGNRQLSTAARPPGAEGGGAFLGEGGDMGGEGVHTILQS